MAKSPYSSRTCPECGKPNIRITVSGYYSRHSDGNGDPCIKGGTPIPSNELQLPPEAPECRTPIPTPTAIAETPLTTPTPTQSRDSSLNSSSTTSLPNSTDATPIEPENAPMNSGVATDDANPTSSDALPGVDEYAKRLGNVYAQPGSAQFPEAQPYSQPDKLNPAVTETVPMDDMALQITAMLKEIFRQYTHRVGRSAQKTLGPSQIGTPCDRRLAMHLLDMPSVNPGNDGWAAFVGTCIHVGLEKMMDWADAGQGRFITELALQYPNENVPHGTADLLDRVLFMVDDYKAMGQWSLDKLKQDGPSRTYRVQLQVYGYGARIRGERVDCVALIGLPRDKSDLSDMYVWTEVYNPAVAREALARVDRIAAEVEAKSQPMHPDGDWSAPKPYEVAQQFSIQDDCRYCDFYMPDAKDLRDGGCNGRT